MSQPIRTVVVGVSTVREPDRVLAPAAEAAEALGADLHVVYAFDIPEALETYPELATARENPLAHYARQVQAALEARVQESAPGVRATAHAVPGPAEKALLHEAERVDAALLVVGASRHGRLEQALLGTVADRVVRGARSPVLVLRTPMRRPERVLLTTDLSELSAAVHEWGAEVATALSGAEAPRFRSLLVIGAGIAPPPLDDEAIHDAARRELSVFLESHLPDDLPVEPAVRTGIAADEIVAEAKAWGADLVVTGTHGRTGFSHLVLGSVAESVLHHVPGSVLVVPARALAAGAGGRPGEPAYRAE